jgi:hypothetical protein
MTLLEITLLIINTVTIMKLSQLNSALVTVCNRLTAVEAALRDRPPVDPDLPTDAEASLGQVNDKIVSLETLAGITPPSTNPN